MRSGSTLQSKASNAENGDSLGSFSISDDGNTIAGGILDDYHGRGVNPSSPCDNDIKDDSSVGAAVVFVRQGYDGLSKRSSSRPIPGRETGSAWRLQLSGDSWPCRPARGQCGAGHQRQGRMMTPPRKPAPCTYSRVRTQRRLSMSRARTNASTKSGRRERTLSVREAHSGAATEEEEEAMDADALKKITIKKKIESFNRTCNYQFPRTPVPHHSLLGCLSLAVGRCRWRSPSP